MAGHDDLLSQGPREAPEPETAEERSARRGRRAVGGGILGGGAAAAKLGAIGGLGKVFFWLIAWRGVIDAAHVFGWLGVLLAVGALATYLVLRHRRVTA
ncbi:MAG: hypothetical protein ACXVZP_10555 [Gaiellaceae bacterium]